MELDIDRAALDRCLPVEQPPPALAPALQPHGAAVLWRLRGWEYDSLSNKDTSPITEWLWQHHRAARLDYYAVSLLYDITVWQANDGQRLLGYMHEERKTGRFRAWAVIPRLVPLVIEPPHFRRRTFPQFDKYQAALNTGHDGHMPRHIRRDLPEETFCPVCTRQADDWAMWPCAELRQYMPPWLVHQTKRRGRLKPEPAPS